MARRRISTQATRNPRLMGQTPFTNQATASASHHHAPGLQQSGNPSKAKERFWSTSSEAEREHIKEFLLELSEGERNSLFRVGGEAVHKEIREVQKLTCSCTVCTRKRAEVHRKVEDLVDAYINGALEDTIKLDHISVLFDNSLIVQDGIPTIYGSDSDDTKALLEILELPEKQNKKPSNKSIKNYNDNDDDDEDEDGDEDEDEEEDDEYYDSFDEHPSVREDEDDNRIASEPAFRKIILRLIGRKVLVAYREKLAKERQERLLEELAEEGKQESHRKAKKVAKKQEWRQKSKRAQDTLQAPKETTSDGAGDGKLASAQSTSPKGVTGLAALGSSWYTPTITSKETVTKETLSTAKTSLESSPESAQLKGQPPAVFTIMDSIEEDVESLASSDRNENPTAEETRADETQSFSTVSPYLTPKQREDIIEVICRAIKNGMPQVDEAIGSANSHPDLRDEIALSIYAFAKTMRDKSVERFDRVGSNIVGRLRLQIASRCWDLLLQNNRTEGPDRLRHAVAEQLGSMPEMMGEERVQQWQMSMDSSKPANTQQNFMDVASPWQGLEKNPPDEDDADSNSLRTMVVSESDQQLEVDYRSLEIHGINPREVVDRFLADPAFMVLVSNIRDSIGRYDNEKLALIRQRVSLAMRRSSNHSSKNSEHLGAIFHVDWDLENYLQDNYDEGTRQELGSMAAVVVWSSDAQCCSVGQYFNQEWPTKSSGLLRAIQAALGRHGSSDTRNLNVHSLDSPQEEIAVDLRSNTISVKGSEDFIVVVAQQVAWLAAACSERQDGIRFAYAGVKELPELASGDVPQFFIDVKLETPLLNWTANCWNGIVGSMVLITGYPVLKRQHSERGLEIPPYLMASLAGIPLAVTFGGGFIFKGRFHALVPIEKLGESVQWHVIDTYPKRLRWEDIDKHCPHRLLHDGDQEKLWEARSFFGWTPSVLCLLATNDFPLNSYQYSSATKPTRLPSVELSSLKMGFNQWGTAGAEIKLGKRDGLRQEQRADDYDGMLDDAKEIPIILHGTKDLRAVQTDAEEMILQILLHQQYSGKLLDSQTINLVSADPSRRTTSVREAMLQNSDEIVRHPIRLKKCGKKKVLFKQDAVRLYAILDALQANLHWKGGHLPRFDPHRPREVHGWEYMDLVKGRPQLLQRRIQLRQTCGEWHKYAKGINAIPLFVENVGDIMMPENTALLCPALQGLPKNKCYLAVRGSTISDLFSRQGSLSDQVRLTESGHRLFGQSLIFGPCPATSGGPRSSQPCSCRRFQRIIKNLTIQKLLLKKATFSECTAAKIFPERSALIIGRDTQLWKGVGVAESNLEDESADEIDDPASKFLFPSQRPTPMELENDQDLDSDKIAGESIDVACNGISSPAAPPVATLLTETMSGNSAPRTLGSLYSQPTGNTSIQSCCCSGSENPICLALCNSKKGPLPLPLKGDAQLAALPSVAEKTGSEKGDCYTKGGKCFEGLTMHSTTTSVVWEQKQ